ncbi:MAG: hypothetical protein NC093_01440 [Alistipes sp.]|nr:hypothetical protein [Alistipes sp.]
MGKKSCHAGHRERLRQRFIRFGADSLFDHELLELLLFYAMPRRNTNEISHRLIDVFGDLRSVLEAAPEELRKVEGIGDATVSFIDLIRQMSDEYGSDECAREIMSSCENVSEYLRGHFAGAADDLCIALCPSNNAKFMFMKNKLFESEKELKAIVESLVIRQCDSIVIGINHGSAPAVPDNVDFGVFKLLSETLLPLGITVSDCIIINCNGAFSLRCSGAV